MAISFSVSSVHCNPNRFTIEPAGFLFFVLAQGLIWKVEPLGLPSLSRRSNSWASFCPSSLAPDQRLRSVARGWQAASPAGLAVVFKGNVVVFRSMPVPLVMINTVKGQCHCPISSKQIERPGARKESIAERIRNKIAFSYPRLFP